jgi:hypothetical protein
VALAVEAAVAVPSPPRPSPEAVREHYNEKKTTKPVSKDIAGSYDFLHSGAHWLDGLPWRGPLTLRETDSERESLCFLSADIRREYQTVAS